MGQLVEGAQFPLREPVNGARGASDELDERQQSVLVQLQELQLPLLSLPRARREGELEVLASVAQTAVGDLYMAYINPP